ncbi:MAG: hypothetical protein M4579_001292 [Chaenotheca gracillima]|nr:MAG: hypothetical protein M4579_001292 [Chaenotheca gracillima]
MSQAPILNTYAAIVSTFTSFLTVAIHTIIYERGIYPANTFLSARKYNFPVRQNRHPKVCSWINDAVAAVESELLKGTVSHVAVVIHDPDSHPLERFLFDVSNFPKVPAAELLTPFEAASPSPGPSPATTPQDKPIMKGSASPDTTQAASKTTNVVDLEEQFRAVMRKLAFCGSSLGVLPDGCSFTVSIELKGDAEAPIGHPQPWIPSEPSLQPATRDNSLTRGKDLGGVKTRPVRAVEAGEFVMELWIEEAHTKKDLLTSSSS